MGLAAAALLGLDAFAAGLVGGLSFGFVSADAGGAAVVAAIGALLVGAFEVSAGAARELTVSDDLVSGGKEAAGLVMAARQTATPASTTTVAMMAPATHILE